MTLPTLYTPKEAADYLGLGEKTLARLRSEGAISYVAISKARFKYREDDLRAYVDAQTRKNECQSTSRENRRITTTTSSTKVVAFTAQLDADRKRKRGG